MDTGPVDTLIPNIRISNSGGNCTNFVSQAVHAGGQALVPYNLVTKYFTNVWDYDTERMILHGPGLMRITTINSCSTILDLSQLPLLFSKHIWGRLFTMIGLIVVVPIILMVL